jgi:hypothetical protein
MKPRVIILKPSTLKTKKFKAVLFDDNLKKIKTINFGQKNAEDFTIHKDEARKVKYIKRHGKEDWSDLMKAGTYSRYILWNLPSLDDSIDDFSKKFNILVLVKK